MIPADGVDCCCLSKVKTLKQMLQISPGIMEFISPNYHLIKNNDIAFICLQKAGKVCTFLHSRRAQRKVLLSSRRVIRMQQKCIQKLIDICGRANISRNILVNNLFIVLEPFENSAAALRGAWQPAHYL